jgi:hypothetical protein
MDIATVGAALDRLRLDGAIFLRGEYSEAWAYESPTGEMMAGLLRPGRDRLLFFHIIASGRCWVSIDDGERHWADVGDVVVIPYGHQHRMGGSADAECVSVLELMSPPPWTEMPVVRHGAGGERTDVICGYLDVDDPLFDPALAALPPIFVVRPTGAARPWVESSLRYVLEATESGAADSEILTRLPAIVLAEVLRIHVASAPIRYLTDWRLHIAKELLATTDLSVFAVARRVGYDAEEAFSRAFKRAYGMAPAHWRTSGATS